METVWCNTLGFAGVNYFNPWWRLQPTPGSTAWIDVHLAFQVASDSPFECEIILATLDALAVLAPEFVIEDVALGDAINVLCEEGIQGLLSPHNRI
jgi:hypothetical protein